MIEEALLLLLLPLLFGFPFPWEEGMGEKAGILFPNSYSYCEMLRRSNFSGDYFNL